ncbi:helix-turn-helix domain-containing protein [Rhizobium sp. 18055]|uniref:helix-turn-helix domain-containing protein n=1 Tax=Rhizobium sp. 18055 TaxID=2681403 RepID=UPI0013592289|nr:AraC family transcriptional regulator [Rhizobium sp. 18055]
MSVNPVHSNQYMDYLKVRQAATIVATVLDKGIVTATRLTRAAPNHGLVGQHSTEDAFMMSVQLHDYQGDLWVDGKAVTFPRARKGNFTLYDYNRLWQANMKSAFDCVNFHIPRMALAALSEDLGGKQVETLNVRPGADTDDATVRGLVNALLPALNQPERASRLFVDHLGLALSAHMAITYGEARKLVPVHTGGLAPWQLSRATEMMEANLDGELSLSDLAAACALSPAYFARAFKASTGIPPYRWMLVRRIERATHLMRTTTLPLSEIGTACGFGDQSHFSRSFSKMMGDPPATWRRERGKIEAS